jgi:acyl-CoA synthetase (AMP-forming)/AMP-acid ligase II
MVLADIIERNARLSPRRLAIIYEGRRLTHADFSLRVGRLANALGGAVSSGSRVAILAHNCIEYLEIHGACERAGYIAVGINVRLAEPEVAAVLSDCTPSVLFFETEFVPLVSQLRAMFPDLRLIAIGATPEWAEPYETILASASADTQMRAAADDIAHLVYTSGTTGRPKGAMLSQGALMEAARITAHEGGVLPTDVVLLVMPLYHIGAKIEQLAFALSGATIVLHRRFDALAILTSLTRERVTAMHLAPILIQRLLDVPDFESADRSGLRCIHYSASPMPVPLLRRALAAFGPVFTQIYGMTECAVGSILKPHQHVTDGDESQMRRLASAGQEFLGTKIRIASDGGVECKEGQIGEVLICSPGVMKGYWLAPEMTAQSLQNEWLHTGDMGFIDCEGYLFLVDRKKDVIVSGGENVFSREVEDALRSHPDVDEVAVIGVPDAEWGESVRAFIILKPGKAPATEDLTQYCRERIAGYKRPREFEFVDDLPRLASGKIDKKQLRAPFWRGYSRFIS